MLKNRFKAHKVNHQNQHGNPADKSGNPTDDILMQRLHRRCGIELRYRDGDEAVVRSGTEIYRVPYAGFRDVVARYLAPGPGIRPRFTPQWQEWLRPFIGSVLTLISGSARLLPPVLCATLFLAAWQAGDQWPVSLRGLQQAGVFVDFMLSTWWVALILSLMGMGVKAIIAPPLYVTDTAQTAIDCAVSSRRPIPDWLMAASTAHGQTKP